MKTLVVLAHPSLSEKSLANRIIVERVRPLPHVTVKDLYRESPGFRFDITAEQAALRDADTRPDQLRVANVSGCHRLPSGSPFATLSWTVEVN